MILHVSNLNTRALGPPTHSHQFDTNCGETWYLSDPLNSFCLILKLSRALNGLVSVLSRLHRRNVLFAEWRITERDYFQISLLGKFFMAWNPLPIYRYSLWIPRYRWCCDYHFPCFSKYIFPPLQACSADCTEGSSSSDIPSNFWQLFSF